MPLSQFNPCIALGVESRDESAQAFCELFGGAVTERTNEYTEVAAGPFTFYFVEDGTRDVAFSVDVNEDETPLIEAAKACGYEVDSETSSRVGETFLRSPQGWLINLNHPK